MNRPLQFVVLLMLLLALLSGCKKKKPRVPTPQEQAPSLNVPPPPAEPQPHPRTTSQPPELPPVQPPSAPRPKPRRSVAHKPEPKPEIPKPEILLKPEIPDKKAVVKSGGAENNTQLAAGIPAGEAMQQRQTTAQLRTSTDEGLRNLTRTLNSDEQAMVQQIRAYLQQSRTAEADGDTERAYNLAYKAHLLANELARR